MFAIVYDLPFGWFFIPPLPRVLGLSHDLTTNLLDKATAGTTQDVYDRIQELDEDEEEGHAVVTDVLTHQSRRRQDEEERQARADKLRRMVTGRSEGS